MGIGRAFSVLMASMGFNVYIISNDEQANHDVRKFI
jgi:D-arabinose 5-phosphate isomerase GutQ